MWIDPVDFLIFAVTAGVVVVLSFLLMRPDRLPSEESPGRVFGPATDPVAGLLPASESGREKVRRELLLAGYYHKHAAVNFYAVRALFTLVPVIAGLALALYYGSYYWWWYPLAAGLVLGVLGFAMPRVVVSGQASARSEEMLRGLPTLMDTLGISLSSGAGITDSIRDAGETLRKGYPDLAAEMRLVAKQADLRSLDHALDQWRHRMPLPEVASLAFLLSQGDRLGTDVTPGLVELSDSYRVTARQRAEGRANRTGFYMLFPTVGLLFVAAMLIVVGPLVLEIAKRTEQLGKDVQDAKQKASEKMNVGGPPDRDSQGQPAVPVPPRVEK